MKSKKLKIVLSVFIAVIVISTATVGIYHGIYISKANAVGEKFGIDDCTDMRFCTVGDKKEYSIKQKMKIYDFMLTYFEKYEITQEEIDNQTIYFGGFSINIGDTYFSFFDNTEIDGKRYRIFRMGNGSSNDEYYIMESEKWLEYSQVAKPDEWKNDDK